MAYNKKTWLARLGQGLNKFILNGGSRVTLESSPDTVTQQGTPLSAENMNDLEQRIADEFSNQTDAINAISDDVEALQTYSSSDEVLIGFWDDAPLFRKLFFGTISTTDESVSIPIHSKDTRAMKFYCRGANNAFGTDYYTSGTDRARCWHEKYNLRFSFGSSFPSLPVQWSVILEYVHSN